MAEGVIVTTSTEGLQPLGSAAQRSYELVSDAVARLFGTDYGALFAEPVAAEHGDRIDWHGPVHTVPLSDLGEDDQAALKAKLGEMTVAIRAEAARLRDSDSADDQRLGEALENALEIPGTDMIYAAPVGASWAPVLVHWAWLRDDARAVRGVLSAMVPRPAAPLAHEGTEQRESRFPWAWLLWLGWILLALMIAAILYLLIAPCGVKGGRLFFCPADPQAIESALSEGRVAADEVAALEREIALVDRQCHPTVPVLPATPVPDAPQDETNADPSNRDVVEQTIEERGAKRGDLNFALAWSTLDDIDLYVTCPNGVTVSYQNRTGCGGVYDLDANVVEAEAINDPVENIVFEAAEPGIYTVRAHLRSERTAGEKQVNLHVLRRDGPSSSYAGKVGGTVTEWTTNISISR